VSLILEIEFLTGVCRAARDPNTPAPDWPPQVDRVFSALVAAWAGRGKDRAEREALCWLEAAQPPTTHASGCAPRSAPECYVPPNDFETPRSDLAKLKWYREFLAQGLRPPTKATEKPWRQALSTLPEQRPGKPRRFPAAHLDDPVMALAWDEEPDPAVVNALDRVAKDVPYIGHSASLARCRFLLGSTTDVPHPSAPARRRIYRGRLDELEAAYAENRTRPSIAPGPSVHQVIPDLGTERRSGWLVLEAVGGDVPDVRASPLVCREIRRTLMAGYRRAGLGDSIPEVVSGHAAGGRPSRDPHLAVVPLAFAGLRHADGRVLGFALVPARGGGPVEAVPGLLSAFLAVTRYDAGRERRILELRGKPLAKPLQLSPVGSSPLRTLRPAPYVGRARFWATVTPMVLDRHLKGGGRREIRRLVADSCERTGLPRPQTTSIQVGKHSVFEGAAPARRPPGAPPWKDWKVPSPYATRSRVHAAIDFGEKVAGPVLLGAGRFAGLGLCRGFPA